MLDGTRGRLTDKPGAGYLRPGQQLYKHTVYWAGLARASQCTTAIMNALTIAENIPIRCSSIATIQRTKVAMREPP
ncbi:hypothetical protein GCM10027321_12620 [Massilia terrae]